jgi:hypothetical protein
VLKANRNEIGFDEAMKMIQYRIHGAGALVAMHILTVLTLTGNCVNREFLRRATLTDACKKNVRDRLFTGVKVSRQQMMTALNGVVRKLGLTEFMVENLLCESLRTKEGFDTFHPSQCIYFLDPDTDNILCVDSSGNVLEERSEADDQKTLQRLPDVDNIVLRYQWWNAKFGIQGMHEWFLKLCNDRNELPQSEVMRAHLNSKKQESNKAVWSLYIRQMTLEMKGKNNSLEQMAEAKSVITSDSLDKMAEVESVDNNKSKRKHPKAKGESVAKKKKGGNR